MAEQGGPTGGGVFLVGFGGRAGERGEGRGEVSRFRIFQLEQLVGLRYLLLNNNCTYFRRIRCLFFFLAFQSPVFFGDLQIGLMMMSSPWLMIVTRYTSY